MKKFYAVFVLAMLASMLALPVSAQEDEFVFGMVLVGPKNDRGWSQAHYEGGLYVEENLAGAKMLVFESLNPADTPEATLESVSADMIAQGAKLIFTTSDSFEKDTDAVAAKYPDVLFINISGSNALATKQADVYAIEGAEAEAASPTNVSNLMAQMEWMKTTAGCIAALQSETGKIGYLGPLINPETRRLAASAFLGARHCWGLRGNDPATLEFNVTWIGFWFNIPGVTLDPTEEVNAFYDAGADVVMSGIDTSEVVVVTGQRRANGENVYSVAYDNKAGCAEAPDACLAVPYYNWGPTYVSLIDAVKAGNYPQASWDWIPPFFNDPANSIVNIEPGTLITEELLAPAMSFFEESMAFAEDPANKGFIYLWQGPLALQDGTVIAEEGELVDPLKIWWLPQLLEGMNGKSE